MIYFIPQFANIMSFAMKDQRMALWFALTMDATSYATEHKCTLLAAMKALLATDWRPFADLKPEPTVRAPA